MTRPTLELVINPDIAVLLPQRDRVRVVRPIDLLVLDFVFDNLSIVRDQKTGMPALIPGSSGAAHLIVQFPPQHIVEQAFFEFHQHIPTWPPEPPELPTAEPTTGVDPPLETPPVKSRMAGPSRLVFRVPKGERIELSLSGLLDACSRLKLRVAANALPPAKPLRLIRPGLSVSETSSTVLGGLRATAENIVALARARGTFMAMENRFGPMETRSLALASSLADTLQERESRLVATGTDIWRLGELIERVKPAPSEPDERTTALELPWRLIISPNQHAAWAHATGEVTRSDPATSIERTELWHSRLAVRKKDGTVSETLRDQRTVRAIWTRDFEQWPAQATYPHATHPQAANPQPNDIAADGSDDLPSFRKSLNSRDRIMIVHQTSNFALKRGGSDWRPPAVPVERLILSSLGGWLDSRVTWNSRPEGFSLEEWSHRAAMGRDHKVRVVYAGFLMPFGHRASLVKVTERRFDSRKPGNPAYLFQRMFIIVREAEKNFGPTGIRNDDDHQIDLQHPLTSVRFTTLVTPDLDPPGIFQYRNSAINGGFAFIPHVGSSPFPFNAVAVDVAGNTIEIGPPLVFVEETFYGNSSAKDQLRLIAEQYEADPASNVAVSGQRVAFAVSASPDDTTLDTTSVSFGVAVPASGLEALGPMFLPVVRKAKVVVPAIRRLTGNSDPLDVEFANEFLEHGIESPGNAGELFLRVTGAAALSFSGQGDRSGGLVDPSISVSALSRLAGPVAGDVVTAAKGTFDPASFFANLPAKLLGVIPLGEIIGKMIGSLGIDEAPKFLAENFNKIEAFLDDLRQLQQLADEVTGTAAGQANIVKQRAGQLLTAVSELFAIQDPTQAAVDGAVQQAANDLASALGALEPALEAATDLTASVRDRVEAVVARAQSLVADVATVTQLLTDLLAFITGGSLPPALGARMQWKPPVKAWPSSRIFDPQDERPLTLSVDVRAPTRPGVEPTAELSCSLEKFWINLIGDPDAFLRLKFKRLAFVARAGKKPDVTVEFEDDGIVFDGVLTFVETLKNIIPTDVLSDPPAISVDENGISSEVSLGLPAVAIGVFSLENITLGAKLVVPFIGEPLSVRFFFSTADDPFRLTVSLFGGGGFFAMEVDPNGMRRLEAAFEFGASVSLNFGVASGGVSVMAGIYFMMSTDAAMLEGYLRIRGEVDVLGLISASIELRMSLSYESIGKCVGRATLTIEVEILFFSATVEISCERKFAGAAGDPTFAQLMDPPGVVPRPWDEYCQAFVEV